MEVKKSNCVKEKNNRMSLSIPFTPEQKSRVERFFRNNPRIKKGVFCAEAVFMAVVREESENGSLAASGES
jgi:hypothetical protein